MKPQNTTSFTLDFQALWAGLLSGMMTVLPVLSPKLGMLFGNFAVLPLLFVCLTKGRRANNQASLFAAVFVVLTHTLAQHFNVSSQMNIEMGLRLCLTILPAFAIGHVLLLNQREYKVVNWVPVPRLLALLGIMSVVVCLVSGYFITTYENELQSYLESIANSLATQQNIDNQLIKQTLQQVLSFVPFFMATTWLFAMVFNILLAQTLAVRTKKNIRPSFDVLNAEIPSFWYILTAMACVLSYTVDGQDIFFYNLVFTMLAPFALVGLSIIHSLLGQLRAKKVFLFVIYAITIFLAWPLIVITLIGLLEPWLNLRHRFNQAQMIQEKK